MRVISLFIVMILLASPNSYADDTLDVSLISVVVDPSKYESKRLRMQGYITVSNLLGAYIFPTEEAMNFLDIPSGLRIDLIYTSDNLVKDIESSNFCYVVVVGTLKSDSSMLDDWRTGYSLYELERVQKLPGTDGKSPTCIR